MSAQQPYISAGEMATFEEDGALIVDLQLTRKMLDAAEAAHDRDMSPMVSAVVFVQLLGPAPVALTPPASPPQWADPVYVQLIASPVFEEIAKQVLRSDKVYILETGRAGKKNDDAALTERAMAND